MINSKRNQLFSIVVAMSLCASAGAFAFGAKGSAVGGCTVKLVDGAMDSPLFGLWQVTSYREINGDKRYAAPGDALLISSTGIHGEACVEFTLPVEGSQHYYLALEPDGRAIDETVYTSSGGELRIIISQSGSGVSFVLYNRPIGGSVNKGGNNEGGGTGDGGLWR